MSNNSIYWWKQEAEPTESRENNTDSVEQNDTKYWWKQAQAQADTYDKYREKGAVRKPEGVEEATAEVQEFYNPYGFGGGYKPKSREVKSNRYVADQEVELEDGSTIYLTLDEINDPNINPNVKKGQEDLKSKYYLEDGSVNRSIFEPKKVVDTKTTYNPYGYGGGGRTTVKEILPYEEELEATFNSMKELKQKNLLNKIPDQFRNWEGENPPKELVQDYFVYQKYQNESFEVGSDEYSKAVAGLARGRQAAAKEQVEQQQEKFQKTTKEIDIEKLQAKIDSFQNDARYIQNKKIEKQFETTGLISKEEYAIYEKNQAELGSMQSQMYEEYEKFVEATEGLMDTSQELDVLKRDHDLLNIFGFNALSTLEGLALGGLEFAEAGVGQLAGLMSGVEGPEDSFGVASFGQERRKIREKAREGYRKGVSFDKAFDSLDNFGRFIVEETGRQAPIFALIAASGGTATALGFSPMASGAIAGLSLGTLSAGQQIGDMTYEEFLSKYNDIQAYGKNLEYNDKEYTSLNKFLTGAGFGAAEGLLSSLPTFVLGSRFFNNATKTFIRQGRKGLLKPIPTTFYQKALNAGKPFAKEFALCCIGESITEGLTTLTQNLITRNPNIWEGVGHATFSGGFFGAGLGGGSVAMGAALNMSMNPEEKAEIQGLISNRQEILKQLEGISDTATASSLKKQADSLQDTISDKLLEAEGRWLNKMNKANYDAYLNAINKQGELRSSAFNIKNNTDLTRAQRKKMIDDLALDYQKIQQDVEAFRNPLDYANKYNLLRTTNEKRYNEINKQASEQLAKEGAEITKTKVNKRAYDIYLLQEISTNNKNAKKALKNVGLDFEAFEFKTEKEAKAFAIKKAKEEGIDLSKNSKDKNNFWYSLANAETGGLNGQAGRVGDKYMYVTTEENQLKNEREGTATHEVGHLIFWDWIAKKDLNIDLVAEEITGYLKETQPEIYSEMFSDSGNVGQRVEKDKAGNFLSEEIIMGFVERIGRIDKTKKSSKSFMYRLGQLFNSEVGITEDLSTQPAIVGFITNMAEKIKDGTLSKEDVAAVETSEVFKSLLSKDKAASVKDIEAKPETKKSSSILNTINNLVPKDVKTKAEFQGAKIFNPIYEATQQGGAIYNYVNSRALSREEAGLMLEGIVDRLINYDPAAVRKTKSGEPITFGEFIFANTRFSKLDAKKQLAIESERRAESLDTEEARQVAEPVAETTTTEAPRVEYKNLVEASVLPSDMVAKVKDKILLITKTLKSRIDAATSINKTVTPLMSEIKKEIGKQADIEFKKMLGAKRGGELRNNFLKLKKPILENMTTTWLMQGMPFAIQKSVDGKFTSDWEGKKIDRESVGTDKAGRTAGAQLVRRLPNAANKITDEQFLTYMFKGDEVIRGRKEALAKALAEEYAFDVYGQELLNPNSEIRKAFEENQERVGTVLADNFVQEFNKQAERGNVKRSVSALYDAAKNDPTIIDNFIEGINTKTFINRLVAENGNLETAIVGHFKENEIQGLTERKLKQIAGQISSNALFNNYQFQIQSRDKNSVAIDLSLDIATEIMSPIEYKDIFAQAGIERKFDLKNIDLINEARLASKKLFDFLGEDKFVRSWYDGLQKPGGLAGFLMKKQPDGLILTSENLELRPQGKSSRNGCYGSVPDIDNSLGIESTKGKKRPADQSRKNWYVSNKFLELSEQGKIDKVLDLYNEGEVDKAIFLESLEFLANSVEDGSISLAAAEFLIIGQFADMNGVGKAMAAPRFVPVKSDGTIATVEELAEMGLAFDKDKLVLEHVITAKTMATNSVKYLINKDANVLKDIKTLLKDYDTAILPDKLDKILRERGTQEKMGIGYKPGDPIFDVRYKDLGIMFLDVKTGNLVGSLFSKTNLEAAKKNSDLDKAFKNATKRSYSENPKGISVYDFDDTLAFSKSQVIVNKDGKSYMITPAEFAAKGEQLLAEGAEFDFSEFNKVVKGQPGPLIPRIQKAIDKFGNKNIFILTARPVASESAIHAFMKGLGIDIPRANITGLANSTAQAKADWMVGKVAEGFNDFYFVDDAIKNVQAVREVLETFDVNSKVQQAIAETKRSMSSDLNQMIERNKGVRAETTYSKVLARKKGAQKGKFKLFVPYSAEDFKGLTSYTLAGKGKQGEADQRFFDKTLILPYTRGIAAMEGATQALKNDYKNLLDMFGLKKQLPKKIGDTDFTTDQAIRVYLWDKQGFDIPNISQRDQNKLSKLVAKDPDLVGFAEGLMAVSKKDQWVNPKDHWDVGSILKDLNDITDNVNRKEYLAEFIENVDEMFDKTTLNKLEAIYGTNYVDALQDSIRRMKSGSNTPRSAGKIERKWLNWVNNSVGTIMFFNRRSALLQMLSFTNFINWSDNNPAKAAAAFANQPLYWKKWAEIFNSDKLKERRGGLKSDIQESEIANQAKNSKDKAAAVVSYLLKIGFTPTQIADSFAIATGGATFLINRTKKYEKQGLSKKEAEAKAFEDFSRISDETQQSGDPMLISQQQSSHLGRLILAFQNTPMQYTRLMKKAGKDIINRRGSDVENLSKIAYYGFVQNLIFSSLQSAMFALLPGFDDEEPDDAKLEDKAIRTANSMVDTILRGSGLAGAVISTLKNAIMRYQKEDKKAQERYGGGDQTYTMLELANISPPIGSKLRKIYSAIQTKKFNQAVIDEMGYDLTVGGKLNPSPNYEIIANLASAVGNLPLDRLLSEVKSITEAFDSRNTSYQRIALALGWRTWDVNVKNEEQDLIKNETKKRKAKSKKRDKEREKELKEFKENLFK